MPAPDSSVAFEGPSADPYRVKAMELWGGNEAGVSRVSVPGFDAFTYCRPHQGHATGGDLRYVSSCAAGRIIRFTLADIAGHGDSAGETALRLRALMRKHINTPDPTRFARLLNEELTSMAQAGRFATAVISTYFAHHLIVCNAGHPRPLLYRAASKQWVLFDERSPGLLDAGRSKETGISNLPLGIIEPTSYAQFATRLEPGDVFILYTDAMIEAQDPAGKELGEAGLLALASSLDPSEPGMLGTALLRTVEAYRGGRPAEDDETLLVLRHNGTEPPPMPFHMTIRALAHLVGIVK
jgi:serine phosphatase RsbU (regulator of sigma subunit)